MNQKPLQSFVEWLGAQAAQCRIRQAEKFADDRRDEGIFETIRANVYEIFRAVAVTAGKVKQEEEIQSFLQEKLTSIPAAWEVSLAQAQAHGDEKKAQTERIKIETAQEIHKVWDAMGWDA